MRRPLRPRDGRKTYSVSGPPDRSDCLRAGVFTKGWIGVQPQGKDRLQETSQEQTVTTVGLENMTMTALNRMGKRDVVTGSLERGLAAGFSRHDSGVQWREKKTAPNDLGHQGPDAPLAHRRPEYPSSGCVPAEPESVSPGTCSLPYWHDSRQKAPQSGARKIPQPKIRREVLSLRTTVEAGCWNPIWSQH